MKRFFLWIARLFASVGAVNWGLVLVLKFDLVEYIDKLTGNIGVDSFLYMLVALSGLYSFIYLFKS